MTVVSVTHTHKHKVIVLWSCYVIELVDPQPFNETNTRGVYKYSIFSMLLHSHAQCQKQNRDRTYTVFAISYNSISMNSVFCYYNFYFNKIIS